jgi:predicted nucleic acid-binding protein
MGKPIAILIDTDVLLDLLLDRENFGNEAAALLSRCEEGTLQGYLTPVIFANLFYFLEKKASKEQAVIKCEALLRFLEVIPISKKAILDALISKIADKEDALQSFAAQEQGQIFAIITRNVKDYKKSVIPAFSPPQFIAQLDLA